jgi:tuberous sclerosis 2
LCGASLKKVVATYQENIRELFATTDGSEEPPLPRPDPITGYVWQGTAPSQRRKEVVVDPAYFVLQLSAYPGLLSAPQLQKIEDTSGLPGLFRTLDRIPVIDTHKVGIMYVAPGQTHEVEILRNTHGSPAYTRFLEGIGRLINLRGQVDVYAGGLNPDEDGEYAYAWWDDIGQILYHTATMMPSHPGDQYSINKKRHIGNDYVRIVWNDSGFPYNFNTLATQFQFVNIVIEPHSLGAIAAFSNNIHENEYFKVTVQRAPGMTEFAPVGDFKLISAENLPLLVRQLSLLADWFASIFQRTQCDTERVEMTTNWHARLQTIKRFQKQLTALDVPKIIEGIMEQEVYRDFTTTF